MVFTFLLYQKFLYFYFRFVVFINFPRECNIPRQNALGISFYAQPSISMRTIKKQNLNVLKLKSYKFDRQQGQ